MKKKPHLSLSPTHVIMLSFLAAILLGSLLLVLPVSSADGRAVPYLDALFTATTATCVTGLVTLPTFSTWSVFGQIVILLLIQIGGLGIITVLAGLTLFFHRKMGLSDRLLLQDAFNLNTLSGLADFIKRVIRGTLLVEGIGALLYMTVFIPDFGARGIWISVFTAVSAFCNAGIDVIGANSLCDYATSPVINAVTCLLILLGGIGYTVWWDVWRVIRKKHRHKFRSLTLHSKIAITTTLILTLAGTLGILFFEHDNPLTMGGYTLPQKLGASLFQSVTTRTAGFATLPQKDLSGGATFLSLFLMFIGGSPIGTAGGVKTVTLAVLAASAVASIRNRSEVDLFGRQIAKETVAKAGAVVAASFAIMALSTLLLCAVTAAPAQDILYEAVSATATVGLTRDLTPTLSAAGKLIVICTMYLGRCGPISLAVAFSTRRGGENIVKNPVEQISVG